MSPLRADLGVADDGAEVTVTVYRPNERGTGRGAASADSLFSSAEGQKRLLVKLYPSSCWLRLDWQDGELTSIRIDGAFPEQPGNARTNSHRVYKQRQSAKTVTLEQDPTLLPASVEFSNSGAPSLLEVNDKLAVSFEWRNGTLAGVRVQGDFLGQVDPDGSAIRQVFRSKHRKNDVALSLEAPGSNAVPETATKNEVKSDNAQTLKVASRAIIGALREEVVNAASGVVAAAWQSQIVPKRVDAALPLVLISQIQRSGGTLLSQLFDNHPEIWAFPHELKWGGALKYRWPNVDPASEGPLRIARSLVEGNLRDSKVYNLFGYQKEGTDDPDQRLPFRWSEWAYVQAFLDAWEAKPPQDRRQCLDMFMSAYFSAFLDWRGKDQRKKIVTAFTPRVNFTASFPENEAFFTDYPDGVLISICRHPGDWYASALSHEVKYADLEQSMADWHESAESSLRLKERYPGQVMLVTFGALIADSVNAMKQITQRLGLTWHPSLTVPTFNGMPIASNSSFRSVVGIDQSAGARRDTLPEDLRARIEADNLALYQRFTEAADIK